MSNVPFINRKNRKKDKEYPKIMKNFLNLTNIQINKINSKTL